jgi:hypothetical protein
MGCSYKETAGMKTNIWMAQKKLRFLKRTFGSHRFPAAIFRKIQKQNENFKSYNIIVFLQISGKFDTTCYSHARKRNVYLRVSDSKLRTSV